MRHRKRGRASAPERALVKPPISSSMRWFWCGNLSNPWLQTINHPWVCPKGAILQFMAVSMQKPLIIPWDFWARNFQTNPSDCVQPSGFILPFFHGHGWSDGQRTIGQKCQQTQLAIRKCGWWKWSSEAMVYCNSYISPHIAKVRKRMGPQTCRIDIHGRSNFVIDSRHMLAWSSKENVGRKTHSIHHQLFAGCSSKYARQPQKRRNTWTIRDYRFAFVWKEAAPKCHGLSMVIWLVVWNIFYFSISWE